MVQVQATYVALYTYLLGITCQVPFVLTTIQDTLSNVYIRLTTMQDTLSNEYIRLDYHAGLTQLFLVKMATEYRTDQSKSLILSHMWSL